MTNFRFQEVLSGKVHSVTAVNYLSAMAMIRHKKEKPDLKFNLLKINQKCVVN